MEDIMHIDNKINYLIYINDIKLFEKNEKINWRL